MKRRRLFSIGLVFLLALIGLDLWWFLRPTATAPEKTAAAASTPPKIDSVKIAAPVAQVEQPKLPAVTPKPEAETIADAPSNTDPQADLETAIPDIARLLEAGDMLGLYKTYTPPDMIDPNKIKTQLALSQRYAGVNRDPQQQQILKKIFDAAARSIQDLETQTPTYNATGTEATYLYTTPADIGAPIKTISKTFIKINGKWYMMPSPDGTGISAARNQNGQFVPLTNDNSPSN